MKKLLLKKLVKKMCYLCIIFSSFQCFDLKFFGLSLFQICLIITSLIGMIYIIQKQYIIRGDYLCYSVLMFISSFIAVLISTNPSAAKGYFLLDIIFSILIIVYVNVFSKRDVYKLLRMLIYSQIITIFLSIFTYYYFYYGGGLHVGINFFNIPIILDPDLIRRMQASSQIRLSLPYFSPPQLSVVMSICIYILIKYRELFKKNVRYFLIIVFSLILILTGSRTGIITLVLVLLFEFLTRKKTFSNKKMNIFLLSVIFFIPLVLNLNDSLYIQKFLNRMVNIDILSDRHFLVPLDGLIIWVSNIRYFLFGIGYGSSINMVGAHTFLPEYFLNSFVTIIVEKGLLGVSIVFYQLKMIINSCKNLIRKDDNLRCVVSGVFLIVAISFVFYEMQHNYFIMFVYIVYFILFNKKGAIINE
ncbi:hypothetical protein [Longibaculum muris]|nr:hypothetical protein [Longibaculum muris]